MKRNKILVTGGAGFIGSHTVELLLTENHEVWVLDNLVSGHLSYLPKNPALHFVKGDVCDFPLLADVVRQVDAVIHLAAIPSVPKSLQYPIDTLKVNTEGTLNVLEAVRANPEVRLVFASSSAVYGDTQKLPCQEAELTNPCMLSPYALQKKHSEDYIDLYRRLYNINALSLRYFNVYGERQDPSSPYSGVISRFMQCFKNQKPFVIFGDGLQSRDFIYVKDVARANLLALRGDAQGAVNIATGRAQSLLELADYLKEVGHQKGYLHEPERAGDIKHSYACAKQAKHHLNFEATMLLRDGIHRLVETFG